MSNKILCCVLAAWGCIASTLSADEVTAFAASSLRDAVSEIATDYEAATGHSVTLVFAASSTVARQVAQGAPADVVLLADTAWAGWLVDQDVLEDVQIFAGNRLALIAREGHQPVAGADLATTLSDGILAMAQVDAVPAGRYGKAALESLGLWDALEPHVVQANNVRAALRFVERGEAQFGIGYSSDLVALADLAMVYSFGQGSHPPIQYSGGSFTSQGAEFMSYILDAQGQDALSRWGFLKVDTAQ